MPSFYPKRRTSRSRSTPAKKRRTTKRNVTGAYTSAQSNKSTSILPYYPRRSMGNSPIFDPFPAKMCAIMRYSESISILPSTGLPIHHFFRATSIFDPNQSGVGHQPYGHDQYAAIYNQYKVVEARCTMTSTLNGALHVFGITLTDDTTVNSDYDTVREVKNTNTNIQLGGNMAPRVIQKYNVNKNFDQSYQKAVWENFGTSPTENMFFDCWAEMVSPSSAGVAGQYIIDIEYVVEMSELKDLGQS